MEDKAKFVELLNDALVGCGGGRYDYLLEDRLVYETAGPEEFVVRGPWRWARVTGDSLAGILHDICDQGVL